jgi:PAS domain S-box-containing protein
LKQGNGPFRLKVPASEAGKNSDEYSVPDIMGKILIIDDEHGFRRVVSEALQRKMHDVSEACNTADGLQLAVDLRPDLIISDVCMAGGDGFSLLKTLRADSRTCTIPFIVMTGHPDSDGMLQGAELAADGYLPKPFKLQTLISVVEQRLNRERALRGSAEEIRGQLQRILEASPDLIGIIDPNHFHFLFLNHAGRKLLGIEDARDISSIQFDELHTSEAAQLISSTAIPKALQEGIWAGENNLVTQDGREVPVKQFVQAHRDPRGSVAFLSTIAHDLTESKKLERERQNMEVQLRHAMKLESIGQLAAGIAHEINTPTQYIGDNTRFLQDAFGSLASLLPEYQKLITAAKSGTLTAELVCEVEAAAEQADMAYLVAEIPRAIQQSLEGVDRVSKIVRAMKDFSHPGVTEKTMVDINQAIDSTITVARNEWKYVAELVTDFDPALPLVCCQPGEFNQVILNILVNAAHAIGDSLKPESGDKGQITVSTRRAGSAAEIRISDTGCGIPEQARTKIFEPFYTTKEVGKGTGQGLAIARSVVVDKHGGSIDFESKVGQGTTFIIRLPLEAD